MTTQPNWWKRRWPLVVMISAGAVGLGVIGILSFLYVGELAARKRAEIPAYYPSVGLQMPRASVVPNIGSMIARQPTPTASLPSVTRSPASQLAKLTAPAKAVQPLIQPVQHSVQSMVTREVTTGPEQAVGCVVATKIPTYRADQFRIELLSVRESARALQVLDGQIMGNSVLNLYNEVKAGNVPRLDRDGNVTVTLEYVNVSAIPDRIWYATGNDICAGFVPVQRTARGFTVTVPIRAGEHRGQTSLLLPRDLFSGKKGVLACATADYDIYSPELIAGNYAGAKNKICGLPGSTPGTTRISEMAADRKMVAAMFGLVKLN